jgi:hypothetical protein
MNQRERVLSMLNWNPNQKQRLLIAVLLVLLLVGGWLDTHEIPPELWP